VFAPYRHDEPAGIERSIAALATGLCELGHHVAIVAAGPSTPRRTAAALYAARRTAVSRRTGAGSHHPQMIWLRALQVPVLLRPESFHNEVRTTADLPDELDRIGEQYRFDLVCWMDSLWGLGILGRPSAPRTGLMAHVLTGCEPMIRTALQHQPDVVLAPSVTVVEQAARCGLDVARWRVAPNGLLLETPPIPAPTEGTRETLRRHGPVRVLSRLAPDKGVVPLLRTVPRAWSRPLEVALAEARFEYYPGMNDQMRQQSREAAAATNVARIVPGQRWGQVRRFLGDAAIVIVPSLAESFGLVALEALSMGTPVIAFAVGNLPELVGDPGVLVPVDAGAAGLWEAADRMVGDPAAYHAASHAGLARAARFTPARVAQDWLAAWDTATPTPTDRPQAGRAGR
jgi:iron(II)-dependent oxidoreductase